MSNATAACRFVGGVSDGTTLPLSIGPDGRPPSRVTFFGGTVEVTYERYEYDLSGGWIYRYDEPHTAKKETQ